MFADLAWELCPVEETLSDQTSMIQLLAKLHFNSLLARGQEVFVSSKQRSWGQESLVTLTCGILSHCV